MNSQLILAAGATCLFALAGVARAQGPPQRAPPSTQPVIQQNAAAPAQPGADASYGGVPATRSAAGIPAT
ncbi:hypothetical protein B0G77_6929 [Paraburkholderia sp. BL10I2N1]|nr:hypothetical protein B0G77_6929 [Paraburkholderia sp. BL10I2N1]